MEAKTECVGCGKWLDLDEIRFPYDHDEPYCQDCMERGEEKAEAYWEAYHEDQNVDRARGEK